jgi:hypothetical protein
MSVLAPIIAQGRYVQAVHLLRRMSGFHVLDIPVVSQVVENGFPDIAGHVSMHMKTRDTREAFRADLMRRMKGEEKLSFFYRCCYLPCCVTGTVFLAASTHMDNLQATMFFTGSLGLLWVSKCSYKALQDCTRRHDCLQKGIWNIEESQGKWKDGI